jgi:phosphomannomutase/phosphoglucomutase
MGIFREYDIRGIADTELPDTLAWALGRALAERTKKGGDRRAYIGRDVRLSSPRLAKALAAGFEAGEVEVRFLKPGPTPMLYYAAKVSLPDFATATGIMVTASHNPGEYNGFKMVVAGITIHGEEIQQVKAEVEHWLPSAPKSFAPRAVEVDREPEYVAYIKANIRPGKRLKVVLDGGNGAGGPLGLELYQALGYDVIPLFCEMDGTFPNHHPDPTVPANLKHLIEKVKSEKADLGIAYDGDADRIGAVTAEGRVVYGDQLVLFYARDILAEIPGATVISEVKSSQILYDTLAKWGAKPIIWKTGHSLIKAKLKETQAALAGEMSGHMFFAHRFFAFDDALYAGARLLEGLAARDETLDTFVANLPQAQNTPELRVDCRDEVKFDVVRAFLKKARQLFPAESILDIDGARIKLEGGWGLLRASNTGPVLVLRFEAPDQVHLQRIRDTFAKILSDIDPEVVVPPLD